jgi:hypothetical protein
MFHLRIFQDGYIPEGLHSKFHHKGLQQQKTTHGATMHSVHRIRNVEREVGEEITVAFPVADNNIGCCFFPGEKDGSACS